MYSGPLRCGHTHGRFPFHLLYASQWGLGAVVSCVSKITSAGRARPALRRPREESVSLCALVPLPFPGPQVSLHCVGAVVPAL